MDKKACVSSRLRKQRSENWVLVSHLFFICCSWKQWRAEKIFAGDCQPDRSIKRTSSFSFWATLTSILNWKCAAEGVAIENEKAVNLLCFFSKDCAVIYLLAYTENEVIKIVWHSCLKKTVIVCLSSPVPPSGDQVTFAHARRHHSKDWKYLSESYKKLGDGMAQKGSRSLLSSLEYKTFSEVLRNGGKTFNLRIPFVFANNIQMRFILTSRAIKNKIEVN